MALNANVYCCEYILLFQPFLQLYLLLYTLYFKNAFPRICDHCFVYVFVLLILCMLFLSYDFVVRLNSSGFE